MSKKPAQPSRRGEAESDAAGDVFDVARITRLVELMKKHDLGEIDLAQGDQKIRLRRGGEAPATVIAAAPKPAAAAPASPPPVESSASLSVIKSPMIGTFYSAAGPDAPPFVKVGDHVGPESTVCIVEAMKVFNEIPAEISGKIVAVLAQNGDPVEFEQPLFKVDTTQ